MNAEIRNARAKVEAGEMSREAFLQLLLDELAFKARMMTSVVTEKQPQYIRAAAAELKAILAEI